MMRRRSFIKQNGWVALFIGLFVLPLLIWGFWGCRSQKKPVLGGDTSMRSAAGAKTKKKGLSFRLQEGEVLYAKVGSAKQVKAVSLDPKTQADIESRLPELKGQAGDKKNFAMRKSSLPPPRTGKTVKTKFPPDQVAQKVDVAPKELRILRVSPQGEVPYVRNLSVTFSQPMVSVTSHADTIAKGVPVKLTPKIEGQWRWVGTQTLLFEAKERFPMATAYKAEISKGIKSARGVELKEGKSWTFETPRPQLVNYFPQGQSNPRDIVIFAQFDQKIHEADVLKTIRFEHNNKELKLKLVDKGEIEDKKGEYYDRLNRLVKAAKKDYYLLFAPVETLAADSFYNVKIGPQTPSAEGPLKTKKERSFGFRTYSPLAVKYQNCDKYKCSPLSSLRIRFNNVLKEDSVDFSKFRVTPTIPEMKIRTRRRSVTISGLTRGRIDYRVEVPEDITDTYGQKLGKISSLIFQMGKASKRLNAQGPQFRVLDPKGEQVLNIESINHEELDVELYRVTPKDWLAYKKWSRYGLRQETIEPAPGRLAHSYVLNPKGESDSFIKSKIDLKPALKNGKGHVLVVVKQKPFPKKRWNRQYITKWIQATDYAIDAFAESDRMLTWVTQLSDGKAVSNAKIKFLSSSNQYIERGITNQQGISWLELDNRGSAVLVADINGQQCMLPFSSYYWSTTRGWQHHKPTEEEFRFFVFDDRKLYKPKEKVNIKGWVRVVNMGKKADVYLPNTTVKEIRYDVKGPRGNKIAQGVASLSPLGGFDFSFKLPDNINLGRASVFLKVMNSTTSRSFYTHRFRIEEFKRPEFEVSAQSTEGPHLIGGKGQFTAKASYFSGGPLANASVDWYVSARSGSFRPPNHEGFSFGNGVPSWWRRDYRSNFGSKSFKAQTNSQGKHFLRIDFDSIYPPQPVSVKANANIKDVNRRTWNASTQLLVHPANLYVGLKSKKYFVEKGVPLDIEAVVSDLDGKRIRDKKITVYAARIAYEYKAGKWKRIEKDIQRCEKQSKKDPVECSFKTKKGGSYVIRAEINDAKGRLNQTKIMRWVSGGEMPKEKQIKAEKIHLIADKKSYQPGDKAKILVQAPFENAEGMLTILRAGIIKATRFSIKGSSTTLEVPIDDASMPSLSIQVDLVGKTKRVDNRGKVVDKLPERPAFARGELSLSVPPLKRKLKLKIEPKHKDAAPGMQTSIGIKVLDAQGNPQVNAGVALVVVDESILALTGYRIADPIHQFYPTRSKGMSTYAFRQYVRLSDPEKLLEQMNAQEKEEDALDDSAAKESFGVGSIAPQSPMLSTGRGKGGGGLKRASAKKRSRAKTLAVDKVAVVPGKNRKPNKIAVRKDFSALALFAPALRTDASGYVSVPFKLPDNLTRYRIFALSVAGGKYYGKSEETIRARLPLMVRPSPPRFLNFGDHAELSVVLHNQTSVKRKVNTVLRATNVQILDSRGKQIEVPANDRVELRYKIKTEYSGIARFQLGISSAEFSDAAQFKFPVWTPATTEAFATYGTIDKGAIAQPVAMPSKVFKEFGGLEITTSSTALQALTDAVLYLASYPYECSEQLSSRILAIASLKDVLSAFKAKGMPSEEKMLVAINRDIKRLQSRQNYSGGFGLWVYDRHVWPFVTVHVTHALLRAKAKGFVIPPVMLNRAMNYLRQIERYYPSTYSQEIKDVITAYSLYVRALNNDVDAIKAKALFSRFTKDSKKHLEALAWLYPVLSSARNTKVELKEMRRILNNRVVENAGTAHFVTSYSDGAHFIMHSNRRVDGLLLEGLIKDQPKSDLIAKIVRGLLAHRKRGRWGNTQENAWVLIALDRYFNRYEKITPNFVASVWLGKQFAGNHAYRGRTTERHQVDIPMDYLAKQQKADLVVSKAGKGRLYYRIGMRYAPSDLNIPPAEHGFSVTRRYEAVDDPNDVKRDAKGVWHIKAGARVKVVLKLVAPTRRYHVALVDPLPAGLEAINLSLKGAEVTPGKIRAMKRSIRSSKRGFSRRYWRPWRWRWYEHKNMRDERVEAFSSLVWGGVHSFKYMARAITVGQFVAPPPKAEEMYHPEVFGHAASDKVVIEDK